MNVSGLTMAGAALGIAASLTMGPDIERLAQRTMDAWTPVIANVDVLSVERDNGNILVMTRITKAKSCDYSGVIALTGPANLTWQETGISLRGRPLNHIESLPPGTYVIGPWVFANLPSLHTAPDQVRRLKLSTVHVCNGQEVVTDLFNVAAPDG